ncbi:hypothetical protein SLA2020_060170 [Shorea laevis]
MNSKTGTFTFSEIVEITSNFKKIIGKGGFGEVYFGTLKDGTDVAVKVLLSPSEQGHKEVLAEAKLLSAVYHENLVSFVGYCDEDGKEALIYDFMANGSLKHYLSEKSKTILNWNERLQIALDVAHGLEYLHGCKPPIVHRDLKPDNILLNKNMQAKIADFGLSRAFPSESATHISTHFAGTFGYLDPDSFKTGRITKKSDVYSFGIILLQFVTGKPAVIARDNEEKINITNWIDPFFKRRDIQSIVDPRLNGEFNINVARKVIKIAMSCVTLITERPDMSHVQEKLKHCLDMEKHSRPMNQTGWLTNLLDKIYKNSTKRPKGAIMKSMEERPVKERPVKEQPVNSRNIIFTSIQIAEITLNFQTVIGKVPFGKVYLGTLNDGAHVAVKVLSHGYDKLRAEVELYSLLYHKNVVSLVGYCDEDGIKALIYEYMANGNLKQHLSEKCERILSWNERLQIAIDVANGLEYLRSTGSIIVRNLDPTDIFLNQDMQAKISDFESERLLKKKLTGIINHIDPMYYSAGVYDPDKWGNFWIILLELLTGSSLRADHTCYRKTWTLP